MGGQVETKDRPEKNQESMKEEESVENFEKERQVNGESFLHQGYKTIENNTDQLVVDHFDTIQSRKHLLDQVGFNDNGDQEEEDEKHEEQLVCEEDQEYEEEKQQEDVDNNGFDRRFPPPIPLLARTGNLPCHMPWILKRSYGDDGRLIIREVKVKHHEFFKARRSNGRLTLQLIHLDDIPIAQTNVTDTIDQSGEELEFEFDIENHEKSLTPNELEERWDEDGKNEDNDDEKVVEKETPSSFSESSCGKNVNILEKQTSNSLFSLPIPTVNPIHS